MRDLEAAHTMWQKFRDLNKDEQGFMDFWRQELRLALPEEERHICETTIGKLKIVQSALDTAGTEDVQLLRGLGVLFGDALAAELDFKWAIVTDADGSYPAIVSKRRFFILGAFYAIEKRVKNGELPIDVIALFNALADHANTILRPKKRPRRSISTRLLQYITHRFSFWL